MAKNGVRVYKQGFLDMGSLSTLKNSLDREHKNIELAMRDMEDQITSIPTSGGGTGGTVDLTNYYNKAQVDNKDAQVLADANAHSDANDATTLAAAKAYTDAHAGSGSGSGTVVDKIRVYPSANLSLTGASGWKKADFNTVDFDTNNLWNATAHEIVIKKAGYYICNARIRSDTPGHFSAIAIGVDGAEHIGIGGDDASSVASAKAQGGSTLIHLDAGKRVTAHLYKESDGTLTAGNFDNYLEVIGPFDTLAGDGTGGSGVTQTYVDSQDAATLASAKAADTVVLTTANTHADTVSKASAVYATAADLGTSNLNNYGTTPGLFTQHADGNATTANNYPIQKSGALESILTGVTTPQGSKGCIQRYTTYDTGSSFVRSYNAATQTWSPWVSRISSADTYTKNAIDAKDDAVLTQAKAYTDSHSASANSYTKAEIDAKDTSTLTDAKAYTDSHVGSLKVVTTAASGAAATFQVAHSKLYVISGAKGSVFTQAMVLGDVILEIGGNSITLESGYSITLTGAVAHVAAPQGTAIHHIYTIG